MQEGCWKMSPLDGSSLQVKVEDDEPSVRIKLEEDLSVQIKVEPSVQIKVEDDEASIQFKEEVPSIQVIVGEEPSGQDLQDAGKREINGAFSKRLFRAKMAKSTAPNGGRGIIWRHSEIMDLLDIWGEESVQEQLHEARRNIGVFEEVSREMAARGHSRTAQECRYKTKAMRLEYKKVAVHNAKSGSAPRKCPYYNQLSAILHGDGSIQPKSIASSLVRAYDQHEARSEAGNSREEVEQRGQNPVSPAWQHPEQQVNSPDLFAEILQTTDVLSYFSAGPEAEGEDEDPDQTLIEERTRAAESQEEVNDSRALPRGTGTPPPKDGPPQNASAPMSPVNRMRHRVEMVGRGEGQPQRGNPREDSSPLPDPRATAPEDPLAPHQHDEDDLACLSPPSRLRMIRGRDRRPKGSQQTDHLTREVLRQSERHHQAFMQHLTQAAQDRRVEMEDRRRDRDQRRAVLKDMLGCMAGTAAAFSRMAGDVQRLVTHTLERSDCGASAMAGPAPSQTPSSQNLECLRATPTSALHVGFKNNRIQKKAPYTPE